MLDAWTPLPARIKEDKPNTDTTGSGLWEKRVEDQEDMTLEARPPREHSTSSDPQKNAPMKVARDPGDRQRKSEKTTTQRTTQRTYPSVLGVQFASRRKEGKRRRNGRGK